MEQTVYIKTYGCQMNERESEALAAVLRQAGYQLVDRETDAAIILLNTCSVREQSELKAIGKSNLLGRTARAPVIGILGCMAQNLGASLLKKIPQVRLIVGPSNIAKVPELLAELKRHPEQRFVETDYGEIDAVFVQAHDPEHVPISAYVSIMQGCNMHCAYCIVPKTRGPERYRPKEEILQEIRWLAERGAKEVTLLGQIVNHYGGSVGRGKSPFVQLLEGVQEIAGIERIRFTSPHPQGFREDLIDAYRDLSKLCPYVHLPLQSGSDKILRTMRRPYTQRSFLAIVEALRERVPTISISTDIIVGFPGETKEDFQQTCETFDAVRFDMAYLFKYSIRPGTVAETLKDQVEQSVKEARHQILQQKLEQYSRAYHRAMVGKTYQVLVEKPARRGQDRLEGRTPEHKKVIFEGPQALIGQVIPVQITSASISTLEGIIPEAV
ncbi:MAG: tRNA (N6-isopentenyl adenosine(37)-C2)-methylthiotransferase MiaB [Verrucomicrobiota bacterium]|nr:MAG: tRNA (N6-isopentenyl adenosine(37)-C2)-methylthiotransferase MiaB [Verrucomicrobiota bacterium]